MSPWELMAEMQREPASRKRLYIPMGEPDYTAIGKVQNVDGTTLLMANPGESMQMNGQTMPFPGELDLNQGYQAPDADYARRRSLSRPATTEDLLQLVPKGRKAQVVGDGNVVQILPPETETTVDGVPMQYKDNVLNIDSPWLKMRMPQRRR